MALRKEWLLPLANAVASHRAKGPVYMLGDQLAFFTAEYARRSLKARGLLRNELAATQTAERPGLASVQSVFSMLGIDGYQDIDLNGRAAITLDFSQPLPSSLHNAAELVVDIGTVEHIFDISQAFSNIVRLVNTNGIVIHFSPVSWYNHGFVNFNPLLFKEFYSHNDFEILEHRLIVTPFAELKKLLLQALGRGGRYTDSMSSPISFEISDDRYSGALFGEHIGLLSHLIFFFAARKRMDHGSVRLPVQGMYRESIERVAPSLVSAADSGR